MDSLGTEKTLLPCREPIPTLRAGSPRDPMTHRIRPRAWNLLVCIWFTSQPIRKDQSWQHAATCEVLLGTRRTKDAKRFRLSAKLATRFQSRATDLGQGARRQHRSR